MDRKCTWTASAFAVKSKNSALFLWICLQLLLPVFCVDRSNFKTCSDSRFCKKHRELKSDDNIHELLVDTLKISNAGSSVSGTVKNLNTKDDLLLEVFAIRDRTVRIKLNELNPSRKRYDLEMSLDGTPDYIPIKMEHQSGQVRLLFPDEVQLILHPKPFRIDVYEAGVLLSTLNAQNLLLIEPMRVKPGFAPESLPTPNVDHVYLILLDAHSGPENSIEESLSSAGLEVERFYPAEGRELNPDVLTELGVKLPDGYTELNRPMTMEEMKRFLGHHGIWRDMVDKNYEEVLVVEDNIRVDPAFRQRFENLRNDLTRLKIDWDLIYLGRSRLEGEDKATFIDQSETLIYAGHLAGAHATTSYLLNKAGAQKLLDGEPLLKMIPIEEYLSVMTDRHPDVAWSTVFPKRDVAAFTAYPMLVHPWGETADENVDDLKVNEPTKTHESWEETFKGHVDSKPYGPNSVGLDVTFIGFDNVYGVPEHADSLRLRNTKKEGDPYRLYNLDVFEYELNNGMALYGAIPFMMAHSSNTTIGFYWNNAAETWIDVDYTTTSSGGFSLFGDKTAQPKTDTHWFSETGLIDIFLFLGPSPLDVSRQFTDVVGRPFLPPLSAIGHHQCRWNYNDEKDVQSVHDNFDLYDIPMDVMWLDIEYTDGKRYFTWDAPKFPNPAEMIRNLTNRGRNLVVISDPHFKKDDNYFVYKDLVDKNFCVKTKDNSNFEGWCWPGASYYPDFLNPAVRDWYAELYSRETFKDAWTWNDMNEPSVFNGPEVTMHKDNIHTDGLEHREIHNIYGMAHVLATFDGHLKRFNYQKRPFILTRSFFAGSQRHAAMWTGDNTAEWSHLKMASPMLLSLNVAGMTFSGADIGGFFKNPDAQLMARWYQAAAFQPFMRNHAHIDTRRREPWVFDEQSMFVMRDAVRARYTFLPFWYTLFFHANQTGAPLIRPLWYEFPKDTTTFAMDDEFLIGNALLVKPVTEEHAKSTEVYFPGDSTENWHDISSLKVYKGGSKVTVDTPLQKIPVYQRSGTIIPRRFRVRRSSILSIEDPITLSIALNDKNSANGSLYLDDGISRNHLEGDYIFAKLELSNNILKSRVIHPAKKYQTKVWLERVYITGLKFKPSGVEVHELPSGDKKTLEFFYDETNHVLTIRKPAVSMAKGWAIIMRQ